MATSTEVPPSHKKKETIEQAVIRFCGDSGDGMQITGSQFTNTAALFGNDLATFPDFPAEIRAPAGTLPGVSGFQVNFSSSDVYTPGDTVDVLVAMNPAALKTNLRDLKPGGLLIANSGAFNAANLKKAGYEVNPLENGSLEGVSSSIRSVSMKNHPAPTIGIKTGHSMCHRSARMLRGGVSAR